MLNEIRSQNQYLIEKNAELEHCLKKEIKPTMASEFKVVKEQISQLQKEALKGRISKGKTLKKQFTETKPRKYYRMRNFLKLLPSQ